MVIITSARVQVTSKMRCQMDCISNNVSHTAAEMNKEITHMIAYKDTPHPITPSRATLLINEVDFLSEVWLISKDSGSSDPEHSVE